MKIFNPYNPYQPYKIYTPLVHIRFAHLNDLDIIVSNNILMAKETESIKLKKEIIYQGVKTLLEDSSKGFYIVAEDNGKIAGNLMITFECSDWRNSMIWWLQSVYVAADCRKQGIFKKMFAFVKEEAQKQKVSLLRLYVYKENITAKKTYSQVGMEKTYYDHYEITV